MFVFFYMLISMLHVLWMLLVRGILVQLSMHDCMTQSTAGDADANRLCQLVAWTTATALCDAVKDVLHRSAFDFLCFLSHSFYAMDFYVLIRFSCNLSGSSGCGK
jgi:hypothetical protein